MRRFLSLLLTIWLASTLTFVALRVVPGDAIRAQLIQSGASQTQIDALREQMGLDKPVITQYADFLVNLARGDLGDSLLSGQPVSTLIIQRFRHTLTLAIWAMFFATLGGVGLGIAGVFDTYVGRFARVIVSFSISTPLYWTGTIAIVIFSAQLGWLPSSGTGTLKHLILPVGILAFHTLGSIAQITRVNITNARHAAFVWVARSKGLTEKAILWRHILRVGLLPVITVTALQTGFLLGGAVITESLFVRPGIGRLLLDSTIKQDYPVVQGLVILSAVVYTSLNTLADLLRRWVDPRIAD